MCTPRAATSGRFCSHSNVSISAGKRFTPRLLEYKFTNSAASRTYLLIACKLVVVDDVAG